MLQQHTEFPPTFITPEAAGVDPVVQLGIGDTAMTGTEIALDAAVAAFAAGLEAGVFSEADMDLMGAAADSIDGEDGVPGIDASNFQNEEAAEQRQLVQLSAQDNEIAQQVAASMRRDIKMRQNASIAAAAAAAEQGRRQSEDDDVTSLDAFRNKKKKKTQDGQHNQELPDEKAA